MNKIMVEQTDPTPCGDIQGVKHSDKGCKSWDSFTECVRFHLLTIVHNETAETELDYLETAQANPTGYQLGSLHSKSSNFTVTLPLLQPLSIQKTRQIASCVCGQVRGKPGVTSLQKQYLRVPPKLLEALECIEKTFPIEREQATKKGM